MLLAGLLSPSSLANKCIEGTPGFSFILAHRTSLASTPPASSLALDLRAQSEGIEKTGQFRFTPPTHAMLAFHQALVEFEAEGGVTARQRRYQLNQSVVREAFGPLGFELYLPTELQGWIISGYKYPVDKNWDFDVFYGKLNERGFVIYPGKVSQTDCFRIGHIGRIFEEDTRAVQRDEDGQIRKVGAEEQRLRTAELFARVRCCIAVQSSAGSLDRQVVQIS